MAALNINSYYLCDTCKHSDQYGRDCNINMMMPVLLAMQGRNRCPAYEYKPNT